MSTSDYTHAHTPLHCITVIRLLVFTHADHKISALEMLTLSYVQNCSDLDMSSINALSLSVHNVVVLISSIGIDFIIHRLIPGINVYIIWVLLYMMMLN